MDSKQTKHETSKNRTVFVAIGGIVLLLIIIVAVIVLSQPTRSVAAYCSTYKQQDAILAKSSGNTYSVHPFTHSSSNPHDFVTALDKLDSVAPKEIEPDVKTLKQLFEKIDQDPSQAMSASMSGLGAESSVANWTSQHCQ